MSPEPSAPPAAAPSPEAQRGRRGREHETVLVVDDDDSIRRLLISQIESLGYRCLSAANGEEALEVLESRPRPALVVSDVHMPGISGLELLQGIKQTDPKIQVVMVSGHHDMAIVRECLRSGAYDYLIKPFELEELDNAVRRALDRFQLMEQNEEYRLHLERMVQSQTEEILQTRDIALMTLAKLAESRDNETGFHLERMAEYSLRLARTLSHGPYRRIMRPAFIEQLHRSAPLHDIGKVGIPDAILLKPGPLTDEERRLMQTHCAIGGDTLRSVIENYEGHTFLSMAMEIAYSHHERWDGGGYPAGLAGEAIPVAARIVALADAYDAITSKRPYKPAFDHEEAIRRIRVDTDLHFDPVVVEAFLECHADFAEIQARLESPQ